MPMPGQADLTLPNWKLVHEKPLPNWDLVYRKLKLNLKTGTWVMV